MDHDSAVTTVLHTDQFICSKISSINCLGSEKLVTQISCAAVANIHLEYLDCYQNDSVRDHKGFSLSASKRGSFLLQDKGKAGSSQRSSLELDFFFFFFL